MTEKMIREAVRALDDEHRSGLICSPGGCVGCGGWLRMQGISVDIILRDYARVRAVLDETEQGHFLCNYQPGHPHAYLNVM